MTTEIVKQLMEALVEVDCHIADRTISIDELKTLLLITYNEILTKDEPLPIIKDYLAIVIKHFIELEQIVQEILAQQAANEANELVTDIIHERIKFTDEENK